MAVCCRKRSSLRVVFSERMTTTWSPVMPPARAHTRRAHESGRVPVDWGLTVRGLCWEDRAGGEKCQAVRMWAELRTGHRRVAPPRELSRTMLQRFARNANEQGDAVWRRTAHRDTAPTENTCDGTLACPHDPSKKRCTLVQRCTVPLRTFIEIAFEGVMARRSPSCRCAFDAATCGASRASFLVEWPA